MLEALACDSGAELSEEKKEFIEAASHAGIYAGLFSNSKRDTGRTIRFTHEIHTGDAIPTRQAVRRLPPPRREGLLADMFEKYVMQPSSSPWAAPIVLVKEASDSAWTTES